MSFRFRPVLALATLAALVALLALGAWQLERRAWKRALIAEAELNSNGPAIAFDEAVARARAGERAEYQRVELRGVFAHDLEARIFGTEGGAAGAYLFTPLDAPAPDGGRRFVYVNRGFVPETVDAGSVSRPEGEVRVEGLFRAGEVRTGFSAFFAPEDQPSDNLWFTRDPLRLAAHHGLETVPFLIDSAGLESAGSWPKGGTTRLDFPNRHLEYALTWFGLAGALLAVYLAMSVKRR